jgi:hypothetical protein
VGHILDRAASELNEADAMGLFFGDHCGIEEYRAINMSIAFHCDDTIALEL